MSISLRKYFSNLFVAIVVEDGKCTLLGRVFKNDKIIKTYEKIFENLDSDTLDEKVISYLEEKDKQYSSLYICVYMNTMGQGAIPGYEAKDYDKYSIDLKNITSLPIEDQKWSIYASYIDIKSARNMLEPLSLDLFYSPFALLYYKVKKRDINRKLTLYMYNHKDSFALAVFKEYQLYFGAFFKTATANEEISESIDNVHESLEDSSDWNDTQEEDGVENLIELDNIDSTEEFETLDDLDNLDSVDSTDFHEEDSSPIFDEGNISDIDDEEYLDNADSSMELFGRDMLAYKYIKSSIEEFYHNEIYDSDFIDDIVIFDNHEMSQTVLGILESELMMHVEVVPINTLDIMLNVAIEDVEL